jgi:hypothetical protein
MASTHSTGRFDRLFDAALATGTLTTIATGGALLGLGWREGEPGRAFRLAGRGLLERLGVASQSVPLASVALGYVHHLVVATAWGLLIALLILPLRGALRVVAALAAAGGYLLMAVTVLPTPVRIGYAVTSGMGGVVSIGAALALALLGGVWLAAHDLDD